MFRKLLNPKLFVPILALSHPVCSMLSYRNLNNASEISRQDLQKNILICYQKTGNQQTDSAVHQLLDQFCDKYRTLISEDFEIIMIEPEKGSNHEGPQLVVFRPQDFGVIPLEKHIKTGNYNKLFTKLNKQLNGVQQIGLQNLTQIIDKNKQSNSEMLFIVPQAFDNNAIRKAKKSLTAFMEGNQYFGREVRAFLIKDQPTKNILKLNSDNIKPNRVYILAPKSKNLRGQNNANFRKVLGKQYDLVNPDPEQFTQNKSQSILEKFVFPPFLKKSHSNTLILKVTVDANRDHEKLLKKIYSQLSPFTDIGKILTFKTLDQQNKNGYKISIERNNFDQLVSIYEPNCKYSKQQKISLLQQTHTWNYQGNLQAEEIKKWIERVSQGKQEQFYKTQTIPNQNLNRTSKKAVGQEYLSLLNKGSEQVFFHYSQSCFSCKKFKFAFEQVAKQFEACKKPIPFYRIDNDENKVKGLRNFNSTPVFVYYRTWKGIKVPFIYKHIYFNKQLFMDFIQISRAIKLVQPQQLECAIKRYSDSKELIKQFL